VTAATSDLLFRYIRWHLLRGLILEACRLCDPKEIVSNENLPLHRIFDETDFSGRSPTEQVLTKQAMDEARSEARKMKALRDRVLAHLDLDTALNGRLLPDVDIETIRLTVGWIVAFQHRVAICREQRPFDIQAAHDVPRSIEEPWKQAADRLVQVLAEGLRAA
jgi:hypothetical protein